MEAKTLSVLEHAHMNEMQADLQRKLQESQRTDLTRGDSLRKLVLGPVVAQNYESANDMLEAYLHDRNEYPAFQSRVERHVQHCRELIQAINTKRNFPGLATLSLSKQQEIHEKVLEHFEELKSVLRHVEKIERDHRLTDIRSTVWVLQSICYTALAVTVAAFVVDLKAGLLSSLFYSVNHLLDEAGTWIVSLLPM
ncbi:MAG: hypothetical protein AB7F86_00025 [Bdellovibrionales bacterium]